MGKSREETRGTKKKTFGKLLKEFGFIDDYRYEDCHYSRINIWYRRLQHNYADYCTSKYTDTGMAKQTVFLAYLLAIYLYLEDTSISESLPMEQRAYSRFINCCLKYDTHSTCTYYRKAISSKEMSFFLAFFKGDSTISEKLKTAFSFEQTKEQRSGVEGLLKNTEQPPEEIFKELDNLFKTPI